MNINGNHDAEAVKTEILDLKDDPVMTKLSPGQDSVTVATSVTSQQPWTAETPHLYSVRITLLKGVCRHSFWPDSGRCLSRKVSCDDVRLIKAMNMNAVRMSHYRPDQHFLEACDELGLYDGGHGASLQDYWNPLYNSPVGAGAFLWMLADEGVVRTDQNGRIDTDGSHAPDGIPRIGTKFQKPDGLGPAGQTNTASGRYHGKVWLHFDL